MYYKKLGASGLKVSPLCLGTMTFGDGADLNACKTIYKAARDKGINFFDCANVYADGESEVMLGKLIKEHRHEVIITSKAFYATGAGPNDRGLSRIHLTSALERSLKRLNTDYIDLYYLHAFDPDTPLEESLSALNDFVRQGKIRYIGLSNFAAWQTMKAIAITEKKNLVPVSCIQPMYNVLKRQCESEILPMAKSENLGVVSYSPLAGGLLTGKYHGRTAMQGRFTDSKMYQDRYKEKTNDQSVRRFLNFARKHAFDPVALAISWVKSHPCITAPIIGARSSKQLESGLKALDIDLSPEMRATISSFSQTPSIATDRTEEQAWRR